MKISEAAELLGGITNVSRVLGITPQGVYLQWRRNGDEIPERWQSKIKTAIELEYVRARERAQRLSKEIERF